MKKIYFLIFGLAVFLLSSSSAKADFNTSGNTYTDWSAATAKDYRQSQSTKDFTNKQICEKIFSFQKDNVLQGTFCDLISIASVATADFAANVTCTIQKVGMSNYDNNIQFTSPLGDTSTSSITGPTGSLCSAKNSGGNILAPANQADIFGSGKLLGNSGTQDGIYGSKLTQVSSDLQPKSLSSAATASAPWIVNGFRIVRGIAIALGLALLFLIAFANILHLDINTYSVKRMLPNLIIALLGGYLSIYFIFIISRGIDFLYQLQIFSPYNTVHPFYNLIGGGQTLNLGSVFSSSAEVAQAAQHIIFNVGNSIVGAGTDSYSLLSAFMGTLFLFIPAIVVFAFEYVLALRPIAIGVLTVISPAAFACYVLPQTQALFRKWWTLMLIALFYTPIVNLSFFLINSLSNPTGSTGLGLVLSVLLKSAVVVFLIRLPFTIESDIKKLSIAIQKSTLTASLGLSKGALEAKAKEQNKSTITDKVLESKGAKSIIAPVNRGLSREVINNRQETRSIARSFSQIINRGNPTSAKEIETISAEAHKVNLSRPSAVLVSSTSDLKPATFRKILSTSNQSIFKENNIVNELKSKNGQVLDNQGAIVRADAARKVTALAKVVDNNQIAHPDAVKSLAQKGMLDVLPLETLKVSLQQGIINPNDLKVSFKDPQAAYQKIVNFRRGTISQNSIDEAQLKIQMEKDNRDATSGYSDLKASIDTSTKSSAGVDTAKNQTLKVIETLRSQNQNYFDRNTPYFIERLKETNNNSRETIAKTMQAAGTSAKTAVAIAQNPNLPFEQIKRYLPPNAPAEVQTIIKQEVDTRDITSEAIGQITKAFKEDKSVMGKTVAEKVSQTMKDGGGRGLDDIKNQLVQSVKTLSSNPNPENAKKAMSEISTFAPGTAISGATTPTAEDIEKTKEKGEQVIGTIEDMKMAGVKDETIRDNPSAAAEQYDTHVDYQVQSIITGQAKDGQSIEGQIQNLSKQGPQSDEEKDEAEMSIDQIDNDQKQQQAATTLSSKTEDGKNFDQQLQDLSASKPKEI